MNGHDFAAAVLGGMDTKRRREDNGDGRQRLPIEDAPAPDTNDLLKCLIRTLEVNSAISSKGQDPDTLCASCPVALQQELRAWQKDVRALCRAFCTQTELHEKYTAIRTQGELLRELQTEATRSWQWLELYKVTASPIRTLAIDQAHNSETYDVSKQWEALRRKHAAECQEFVFAHQAAQLNLIKDRLQPMTLQQALADRFTSWAMDNREAFTSDALQRLRIIVKMFSEAAIANELPKAKSRIAKAKKEAKARNDALDNANAAFQNVSGDALAALAALHAKNPSCFDVAALAAKEAAGVTKSVADMCKPTKDENATSVVLQDGSLLEMLLREDPQIREKFGISVKKPLPATMTLNDIPGRGRSQQRSQHRSQSQRRSHSQSQRPNSTASTRSKGKGKSKEKSRGKSQGRGNSQG
eukprot:TRINITY_DN20007_c0_g1_i1.p1 TRINITY_DN20007_c0_g1~~TRINITY_DN20007_c0_g1_i1.p1  ORF type:complete len:414 (-),score=76.66 TRINITY_DN20007_c0_g1_i1:194-1435(-)